MRVNSKCVPPGSNSGIAVDCGCNTCVNPDVSVNGNATNAPKSHTLSSEEEVMIFGLLGIVACGKTGHPTACHHSLAHAQLTFFV